MQDDTFVGGCHCKAVRYQVSGLDVNNVVVCNCSRCSMLGSILSFVPAESFNLQSGEDHLTDYQFNRKIIHHLFCNICGVQSFSRGVDKEGKPMIAINVRCLDGVDTELLSPEKFNGKDY